MCPGLTCAKAIKLLYWIGPFTYWHDDSYGRTHRCTEAGGCCEWGPPQDIG